MNNNEKVCERCGNIFTKESCVKNYKTTNKKVIESAWKRRKLCNVCSSILIGLGQKERNREWNKKRIMLYVLPEVRSQLSMIGHIGDTYGDAIQKLINFWNEKGGTEWDYKKIIKDIKLIEKKEE